jgi:two-component system chemotaxis sensor kinase CheA
MPSLLRPVPEQGLSVKLTPVTTALVQPDTTLDLGIPMSPLAAAPTVVTPTQKVVSSSPPPELPPVASAVASPPVEAPSTEPPEARPHNTADTSIRVDVNLLDKLMTLMGELVLARNQILRYSTLQEDSGFLSTVQRLNLLTTELQASVMKTRMQPIGNVLSKFPRIVRDLALACGKKVRFEMEGQDTELDKTLLRRSWHRTARRAEVARQA